MDNKCKGETTIYSRVTGFYSTTATWNPGKREEFKDRNTYELKNYLADKKE